MEKTVSITGLAFGGRGVGRIDGKVVFVPFTAPGDEVRVRITADKKGFSEGEVLSLLTPSPIRRPPACGLFGRCGGCSLQHIKYPEQVRWKETIFEETVKRIGKTSPERYDLPEASGDEYYYRTRARLHAAGGRWGFFEAGSHRIVDVEGCPILDPRINDALKRLRGALMKEDTGLFAIDLGVSKAGDRAVAAFHVSEDTGFGWKGLLRAIEGLKGLEVRLSPDKKDRGVVLIKEGDTSIFYKIGDMEMEASISVFSQVNPEGNNTLIKKVIEYSGLTGAQRVLDLFSGAGNLTLPLARLAKEAVGVESARESVAMAKRNASRNNVPAARFAADDAGRWLRSNMKTLEKEGIDVVVLDPPRGGEPDVARALEKLRPQKLVYVSCSPPTLARDISLLTGCGYRLTRAGLFDMFPQTFHIECIAGLELMAG